MTPEVDALDRTLHGLRRSSSLFTAMAGVVILVVLISSIYTNVRVVQITNRVQTQQHTIRAQQHRIAITSEFGGYHTCLKVNDLRGQFLKLVDDGVSRSKAAAEAATATPVQKLNYLRAKASAQALHDGLPLDDCVRPKETG